MISDITMQGDSASIRARKVSDRLRYAVYDLDVLAGILEYLVDWARSGDVLPPRPASWHDPDAWEGNVATFGHDTAIEYTVALSRIRACVRECGPGVQGLLSALRASTSDPGETTHERVWVVLENLASALPDDLVDRVWEREDPWHELSPDLVGRIMDAAAIANRLVPAGTVNELVFSLAHERTELAGAPGLFVAPIASQEVPTPSEPPAPARRTPDPPALVDPTLEDVASAETSSRKAKRLLTHKLRGKFGEWMFFDDRVEHRGKRIELRKQETLVFEWFVRAGEGGLTREALGKHFAEAGYTVGEKLTVPVSRLATRLQEEPGWSGYIFEGDGRAGSPRRLVVPPPRR